MTPERITSYRRAFYLDRPVDPKDHAMVAMLEEIERLQVAFDGIVTLHDGNLRELEQAKRELAEKSEQVLHIDNACWYCANPGIEDPWRHEHEPDGAHWHHCIDPGDGLPSNCANSDRLERIFGEQETELTRLREALTRLDEAVAREDMARGSEVYLHRIIREALRHSPSKPEDV